MQQGASRLLEKQRDVEEETGGTLPDAGYGGQKVFFDRKHCKNTQKLRGIQLT